MDHLDTDGSGYLCFHEWYKWWQTGLDSRSLLEPEAAAAAVAATQRHQAKVRGAAEEEESEKSMSVRRKRASCVERAELRETESKATKDRPERQSRLLPGPQPIRCSAVGVGVTGATVVSRKKPSSLPLPYGDSVLHC